MRVAPWFEMTLTRKQQMDLVEASMNGNGDAFAALYEEYDAYVRRLLREYSTRNISELDDLSQSAWLHVFQKLHLFHGNSSFKSWLHRVVINHGLGWVRSCEYKHSSSTLSLDTGYEDDSGKTVRVDIAAPIRDPDVEIDVQRMLGAVSALPHKYRVAVTAWLQGDTLKQACASSGINLGAAKSRLHRGVEKLQQAVLGP